MNTLLKTNLNLPGQLSKYTGKVREVYRLQDEMLVMIATDRISAFDVVLTKGIPHKGQILNQIAVQMLKATADIVPNWLVASPDPNVSIGVACNPFKIEMVIRGYLTGHAAREYKAGKRFLCGVEMPEGMIENERFPTPIITPATKAEEGHDEDISREEIINQGIVAAADYEKLENFTQKLFERGTEMAAKQGLILVDTKYEFGKNKDGEIMLIDEIHTPDSSRYFYKDTYDSYQNRGLPQRQLSKEFVRQWLMENGFQGLPGQKLPFMKDTFVESISARYIELYEKIIGQPFEPADTESLEFRIEKALNHYFKK